MSRRVRATVVALVLGALAVVVLLWHRPGTSRPGAGRPQEPQRRAVAAVAPGRDRTIPPPARAAGLAVDGVVIDEAGAPVAHAAVLLTEHDQVRSGDDGRFHIADVAPGIYNLNAYSNTAAAGPLPLRLDDETLQVTVRLHAGVSVTVAVVAATDGRPIPRARGAIVLSGLLGEAGRVTAVAGADGVLHFPVTSLSNSHVVAEADGFAPTTKLFTWNDRAGLAWRAQIALEPGVVLTGRVIDERGAPVVGAHVTSRPPPRAQTQVPYRPRPPDPLRAAVDTDARGQFHYPVPVGQGLVLVARHERYAAGESAPLVAAQASEVTIMLKAGRALSGRVIDRAGKPVANALVTDGPPESGNAHITRSDGSGAFVLAGFDPRQHQAILQASTQSGRGSQVLVALPDGFDRALELVIDHELRIAGVVLDSEGAPVADAVVQFRRTLPDGYKPPAANPTAVLEAVISGETRSDGDGAFAIAGLAAGGYQLLVRGPSASPGRASIPLMSRATAKAGDEQVQVTLPAAAGLRGRVVRSDGRPARAFDVALVQLGGPVHVESADARFEIRDLDPAIGRYLVRVTAEGCAALELEARVTAGKTTDLGTITLSQGRTLRGRVLESSGGGPVANAVVTVDGPQDPAVATGRTDDLGSFEIPVPMGPVTVHAAVAGVGGSRFELVPAGRASVELRLPETGRLEVEVTGSPAGGELSVTATRSDAQDGGFRVWVLTAAPGRAGAYVADVSPGNYLLHAVAGRGLAAMKRDPGGEIAVTVAAGQTQRVELPVAGPAGLASP